jgi:hypothetical protein
VVRESLCSRGFRVGGEITKAARNSLGNALDASKRSHIMFLDRDILNLYVVTDMPMPAAAIPTTPDPWNTNDEPPF